MVDLHVHVWKSLRNPMVFFWHGSGSKVPFKQVIIIPYNIIKGTAVDENIVVFRPTSQKQIFFLNLGELRHRPFEIKQISNQL